MEEIRISFEEDADIELDEIDIGVADSVLAFEVSGRIDGLDDATLSHLAGKQLNPVELRLEAVESQSSS